MAFSFSVKKILITGAGRGIGRALAKEIVKAKGEVFALSKTKETLDSLAKESDQIHPILADLSNWDETREKLKTLESMDGVDDVVNNAACIPDSIYDITECPNEIFEEAIRVNLMGAINVTQVTAKKMIEAGKGGSIVNVSRRYNFALNSSNLAFILGSFLTIHLNVHFQSDRLTPRGMGRGGGYFYIF